MSVRPVFVLLICLYFTWANFAETKTINAKPYRLIPYDLVDDAKALLEDLSQLILGHILVAHSELEDFNYEILSNSINVRLQSEIDIEQEYQTLDERLIGVKDLALAAEQDITSCLDVNEDKLNKLPDIYNNNVTVCISTLRLEANKILNDTRYHIDILYNTIHSLSFTLGRCGTDKDCVSGVINQIKAATDDLPLQIEAHVEGAGDEIKIVRVKIQNCADTNLANFVLEGSGILDEITDCVNALIS